MRKPIFTKKGAPPKGPYSQAIVAQGPMLFISAQGPVMPESGTPVEGSFRAKAEQVFRNISAILEAAGSDWQSVVKVGVLLNDMGNFAEMNDVYMEHVTQPYPARTTAQSTIGAAEIFVDCIALCNSIN